jgi:hypothetical protein
MTDLVKRLRKNVMCGDAVIEEAADRIEHLEDRCANLLVGNGILNIHIKKLEAALRVYAEEDHWSGDTFEPIRFPEGECKCCYEHFSDQGEIARKALEGKDD